MERSMGKRRHAALIAGATTLSLLAMGTYAASARTASSFTFAAALSGEQEVPAVTTESSSFATAQFDRAFTRAEVRVRVRGDIEVVAAHFHCALPGANGPVAFGLLNPGQLTEFDDDVRIRITNADFTGADCTATVGRPVNNIAALALAMQDGLIYINLHSPTAPTGEVRGQMIVAAGGD